MERTALYRKFKSLKIDTEIKIIINMKSIICGAGDVGYSIADKLSKEGFEVTVVDESKERLKKISENLRCKNYYMVFQAFLLQFYLKCWSKRL